MSRLRFGSTVFLARPKTLNSKRYGHTLVFMNALLIDLLTWLFRLLSMSKYNQILVYDNFSRIRYFVVFPAFGLFYFVYNGEEYSRYFYPLYGHSLFIFSLFTLADAIYRWSTKTERFVNSTFEFLFTYSDDYKLILLKNFNVSAISSTNTELVNLLNNRTLHCLPVFVAYCLHDSPTENVFLLIEGILQYYMTVSIPVIILFLLTWMSGFANAQDNTPEYNQAAYRTKREMHLFQLAEWSRQKNPEVMDAIKYQMAGTIYQVLSNAKDVLEKNGANDPNHVPKNLEAGDAWALVVENSALLCELVVRFPETANSVLSQPNYRQIVGWALDFLLETKYPNDNDVKLIQFAKYELRLASRPEGYRNPFSEENQKAVKDVLLELERKKKLVESRKQARRPKLSPREDL